MLWKNVQVNKDNQARVRKVARTNNAQAAHQANQLNQVIPVKAADKPNQANPVNQVKANKAGKVNNNKKPGRNPEVTFRISFFCLVPQSVEFPVFYKDAVTYASERLIKPVAVPVDQY